MDSHEFVAGLFADVPEDDRVAAMERYIHATFIQENVRNLVAEHELFMAARDPIAEIPSEKVE